jgi:hypothetical protein
VTSAATADSDAPPDNFFPRAALFLLLAFGTAGAVGHFAGKLYRPHPLTPPPERIARSDRFVLLFGNSRFRASIDPARLASELSVESTCDAALFTGGGWDALHYYMLALLARDQLRPGQDAVVIEVSPLSLNDAQSNNRLGAIRPEVGFRVAGLPGEPLETRLNILLGTVVGLYRYRGSIQHGPLRRVLSDWADSLARPLARVGLLGPPRGEPSFRLVPNRTGDGIEAIRGDREAFQAANRSLLEAGLRTYRIGGFKQRALERAVTALREKDVAVYLVCVPLSRWAEDGIDESPVSEPFRQAMASLAARTGASFLEDWGERFHDEGNFWDDTHMTPQVKPRFTDALGRRLGTGSRRAGGK